MFHGPFSRARVGPHETTKSVRFRHGQLIPKGAGLYTAHGKRTAIYLRASKSNGSQSVENQGPEVEQLAQRSQDRRDPQRRLVHRPAPSWGVR